MRLEIEAKLHAHAVNIYGLSEIIGPGVSNECIEAKDGMHIMEDPFLPEVIDSETGVTLPDGEVGELVFTTLTKQALPLIRYRTGDLCSLNREPCICGRTHVRMSRILGRADDMLIIRGVNVFPSQIEAALLGLEHVTPHHQLIISREDRLDTLEAQVKVTESFFRQVGADIFAGHSKERIEKLKVLENQIHDNLRDLLGLNTKVTLLIPGGGARSEGGKLSRVDDRR